MTRTSIGGSFERMIAGDLVIISKMHERCRTIEVKLNTLTTCSNYRLSLNVILNTIMHTIHTSTNLRN